MTDCSDQGRTDRRYCVDVVRDIAGLDGLQDEWAVLFRESPAASPPLRWEWIREWWAHYGPSYGAGGRGLRILAVRRDGALAGVLPLYLNVRGCSLGARRLRFVSTGAAEHEETTTEYLGLLSAPGENEACLRAIGGVLSDRARLVWDELDLAAMPAHSALLSLKAGLASARLKVEASAEDDCYISDLTGGFESYLMRLSSKARASARRLLRDVERGGLTFETASDPGSTDRFFDEMVELHHRRWEAVGKSGSFSARHAAFHKAVARRLVPSGGVVLSRLSRGGEVLAVAYGHRVGREYHCYQRGVQRRSDAVRSPGTAVLLMLMRHLTETGVGLYDHLAGANPFKEEYSTGRRGLVNLRATSPSWRSLVSASVEMGGRLRRGLKRRMARPAPSASAQ